MRNLCPVNTSVNSLTWHASRLPLVSGETADRARRIGEVSTEIQPCVVHLPIHRTHLPAIARHEKQREDQKTMAVVSAAIYEVSKLHVVSREIYGIGVVQVSGILGIDLPPRHTERGTSYYGGGPIYRAPVSDRDLFDAPTRGRGSTIMPPPLVPGGG